jgi:PAS domain S-box-containing protein
MTPNGSSPALPFVADVAFQAGDIVFATDRFGRVVYWNSEAEAVAGYKVEEALGKPYTLACRIEPDGTALDVSAVLAGRDFAGGVRCRSRSGGDVVLYLFATAGRDSAGKPAGVVFVGRDVTGLWQAEEAAQATADKYRVLFENTLDAVAIADVEGKVLEANPACLRLYGLSAEELRGTNLTDAVAAEDRSAAADAMANLAGGRPVTKIIRMRRKDGTRFVVDLSASVMLVGGERRIMAVTRDVTDRVRAEQARSQSERMYRTIFESANDAVFIEAVDGRILDVNRNGCELLGYTKAELIRRGVSDLVPTEARAWLTRVTDAILRDGTLRTEAVRVHRSGRHIPVDISASTMELDGRTAILSIVRDITARKLAEQTLRESEEKFRSVSEQSPNMIFINSRGRVVYANQKSVDIMGYTREEFYADGFDFMRLIAPESAEQIKAVYTRHGRGEEVEPYEYALVTKDGRRIESIITTKLIDYEGTKAILGIVTDITERVAAERALREEKERSQTYLTLAGAMLVALDAAGITTLLNRRACQVLGVAETSALGRNWFDSYVPERSRDQVKATFAALMEGNLEPVEYYENPVVTLRGEERLVAWHNTLLRDETGRVVGTLSSGEDITDRKAAEQALRESERQYRTALEAMRDPVHVADADLRIVMVNQAFTAWLRENGFDDAVLGKAVFEVFPFLPDRVREEYRRVFDTGEPIATEEETVVAGRTFITETTKMPVTEHGRVVRVLTVIRDVTERRRLAKAAEETADELRAVLDNSPGAIVGECDGVLVYANQKYARLLGYDSPADIIGRTAADFDAPEGRELMTSYTRMREQGKDAPTSYSFHGLRRDGTILPLEATISTYRSLGRLHVLAFIREVEPGRGGS